MLIRQIGLISLVVLIGLMGLIGVVKAATVSGYAWSENIGWVKFDGPGYAVSIDETTGNLTGYAWSENVGWIKFDPAGPYPGVPNYSARFNFTDGKIRGWARACAGAAQSDCSGATNSNSGFWDGWIRLSGGRYGVRQVGDINTGCFLGGYAWGSTIIGWLKFGGPAYQVFLDKCLEAPVEPVVGDLTCDFTGFPRRLIAPQRSSRLTWSCENADRCRISGLGNVSAVSGSRLVSPSQTTTYTLICNNDTSGQSVSLSQTVTVIRSRICEIIPFHPDCPRQFDIQALAFDN